MVAIAGVVSIHVLIAVYNRADFQGGGVWWLTNIWNAAARPAIPLFIMLSGFLLLPKKESNKVIFNRIIYRLFIPLLAFSALSRIWDDGNISFQKFNPSLIISSVFEGNVGIFYFLIIMIGLYALLPIIRKVFIPLSRKRQFLVSTIVILLSMVISLWEYTSGHFFLNNMFVMWLPYLGFFLMGHVLAKVRINHYQRLIYLAMLSLMIVFNTIMGNQYLTQVTAGNNSLFPSGALSQYYDFFLSPNVVIMSLSLYILLFQFNYSAIKKSTLVTTVVRQIASASLGIYLLHLFVNTFLEKYLKFSANLTQLPLILYLIIKFLLVMIGSYGLTLFFRRIPILSQMIGERVSGGHKRKRV